MGDPYLNHPTLQNFVIDKIDDMKAQDIQTLDVREHSSITDFMVICTGTSNRHVHSIADHVKKTAQNENIATYGISGDNDAEWIIVDLGDVVLHVMQEATRDLYQLEKLWA